METKGPTEKAGLSFIIGTDSINQLFASKEAGLQSSYKKLEEFYRHYADFTEEKMTDYEEGKAEAKYALFNSADVTSIIVVDNNQNIVGTLRLFFFQMHDGKTSVYFPDEIANLKGIERGNVEAAKPWPAAQRTMQQQ